MALATETQTPISTDQNKSIETSNDSEIIVPPLKSILFNLPDDFAIWGRETFSKENIPALTGILGITTLLVVNDYETWGVFRAANRRTEDVHQFNIQGVSMGDGFFQFGMVGGFVLAGKLANSNRALRTALQTTESIFATGTIVQIIKHITGRESPFSSESRTGKWRVPPNQLEYLQDFQKYDAMPSGHLSTATTTLFVIMENYPEQKWIPFVGYPWLAWISIGLAGTGIHWWSDYPIALALGYQFAKIVTRNNHAPRGGLTPTTTETKGSFMPSLFPSIASTGEPTMAAVWEW